MYIQYTLLIFILISLSAYFLIVLKHLKLNEEDVNEVINEIINAVIAIVLICDLRIQYELIKNSILYNDITVQIVTLFILAVIFFVVAMTLLYIRYSKYNLATKKTYIFTLIGFLSTLGIPAYMTEIIYFIALIVFLCITFIFSKTLLIHHKMHKNYGIYFIIVGSVSLFISSLYSALYISELFNMVNLALMTFIVVGFFLFFIIFFNEKQKHASEKQTELYKKITEKNNQIFDLAYIDRITNIPNKFAFDVDLLSAKTEKYLCLANVRNFMQYNNLLGFDRGNEILGEIATKLRTMLPDIRAYHFYADKFILVFPQSDRGEVYREIEKIQEYLKFQRFQGVKLDVYYGLYHYQPSEHMLSEGTNKIIERLEVASEYAKKSSDDISDYSMIDPIEYVNEFNMELAIRDAIDKKQFSVVYQPQVEGKNHTVCSYEALIRWEREDEFIYPSDFIPIAEKRGYMREITYIVIERVFYDISTEPFLQDKRISINLSADQLIEESFLESVSVLQHQYTIATSNIVFEITETGMFNDMEKALNTIKGLKQRGYEISLDDFGEGYSSILRFTDLEIDEIKFDKSFIDRIQQDKVFTALKKLSELFDSFDLRIVLEGIENQEQLDKISDLGIDVYQGYYFHKPMSLEECRKMCENT
jgi:EAL domain-containing protein (putative c-di-GMP-specific phosphodiesterase class I)/GGDEF domain-containing protein